MSCSVDSHNPCKAVKVFFFLSLCAYREETQDSERSTKIPDQNKTTDAADVQQQDQRSHNISASMLINATDNTRFLLICATKQPPKEK